MSYWDPDYVIKETALLALFCCTTQPGVDPAEATALVRNRPQLPGLLYEMPC